MQIGHPEMKARQAPGAVLGIESSCDETAVAVLDGDGHILAETLRSQTGEHAPFGGVVPEVAARAHLAYLAPLTRTALAEAGIGAEAIAAIAATSGPGLIGGLIVGANFGKGLALAWKKPFLAINHLEAHALTARLPGLAQGGVAFPYLLLLVSGGHCQFVAVEGLGRYHVLGRTLDDAAGEAFDKAAKLLGLSWPGGPALERLAGSGNPRAIALPRPLLGRPGCDFSFSGLKTALAQAVAAFPAGALPREAAADLAASFQSAVADVLTDRTAHALALFTTRHPGAGTLVLAGGVAANQAIRTALTTLAAAHGFRLIAPPLRLCTDNAVMVAWAGIERLKSGATSGLDHAPRPRWPLDAPDMALAAVAR